MDVPQGSSKNDLIPDFEEDGTKGGSLSSAVSISFKEIEETETDRNGSLDATLSMPENCPNWHADTITTVESEAIQMFITVARWLGYPRSVGEIFGVLFAAEEPLSFDGICRRSGISTGSLSVGLRHLRNLRVVITATVAGDRRDFFTVNEDFGWVIASLIRCYIEPRISAAQRRTDRIRIMADRLARSGSHGNLAARLHRFADSHSRVVSLITPLLKPPQ